MKLKLFHIDAFTREVFHGNAACVAVSDGREPDDRTLLQIAAENGVAETAFLRPVSAGCYRLRWFTPDLEMDLCGHATLAAAFAVCRYLEPECGCVRFLTCGGDIQVLRCREEGGRMESYELDFPSRPGVPAVLPGEIGRSLNLQPAEVYLSRDYVLVYDSAEQIRSLAIDRTVFDTIDLGVGGVAVTAPGEGEKIPCDFVSRFFTPGATIWEDPVTGSAHCTLVPYWARRFGKSELHARQISERGGDLFCRMDSGRIRIRGEAVCYLQGEIEI